MKSLTSLAFIILSILLVSASVDAAVTTYSDRSAYDSAAAGLGTPTTIDFTTRDNGDYITVPGSDTYFNPLTLRGVSFEGRSYYNDKLYDGPGGITTAVLPENTYAFGLEMFRFYGVPGTFTITLSTGEVYSRASTVVNGMFFGGTSDEAIEWVKISFDNDFFHIDNFVYGANAPIAPPPVPPLLSGVVSHWPGEGDTNDVVGPNNGTFQNGSAYEPGVVGQSFSLDGVSRYITAPDSPSLSLTNEFTLEARINLSTNNRQQAIIEKYDVPGRNGYLLRLQPDGRLLATICDPVTCDTVAIGETILAPNTWYHVAAAFNGGSIRIYVNGVLDGLIVTNRTLTDGSANLKIGARGDDANTRFGGRLDEVRIFNRALSEAEVQNLSLSVPRQSRAYVTNQGTNRVEVIDLATNAMVGSIPVGIAPFETAINPEGTRAYVTNSTSNDVSVIDTALMTRIATIPVGDGPVGVAVTPDGTHVYVANDRAQTISVINTATNTVVSTIAVVGQPDGIAITPDGTRAYVTTLFGNTVTVIDTATNTISAIIPLPPFPPHAQILPFAIDITPDGSLAVVANLRGASVTIIDTSTNTIITTIYLGGFNARDVDISSDGRLAYVAVEGLATVKVIDLITFSVVATFPVGVSPFGVAVSANGSRAYVANYNSPFYVIDAQTGTLIASISSGSGRAGVTLWEVPPADSTPPQITPTVTGTVGNAGWYTSDIGVNWAVSDAESAVSASSGCDAILVTADTTETTFACTATSSGGTATQSVTIQRDATAPAISCGSADGAWHSTDVSFACNSSDRTSGLASDGDTSFSLSTSVAAGTETANAPTDSRGVCDIAGNCTVAGPISGNMIDKKAPEITIVSPTSGSYIYNQSIFVNYTCTDGGSLVALCNGTTLNGELLDTGSTGNKTFTVNATDNAGNGSSTIVNYIVIYAVPTNIDECKNGGWQTLQRANGTLFNNQGDCVSYVNTGL